MPKRNTASAVTREKFTGHERDNEVGLDYMVWRRYDPALGRFLGVDPHDFNYPHLSPYVYAANNPLIYVDPDGRDITITYGCNQEGRNCSEFVFTGDNIDEARKIGNDFINQFLDAYEYAVENNQQAYLVEAANNRDLNVGLRHFNDGPYSTSRINSYHFRGNVYWLPTGGLSTDFGVLSPTTVLEHEMAHAVSFLKTGESYTEFEIIRGAETNMARALGEIGNSQVTRFKHTDGHTVGTYGPTSNTIDKHMTLQYYLWLVENRGSHYQFGVELYRNR